MAGTHPVSGDDDHSASPGLSNTHDAASGSGDPSARKRTPVRAWDAGITMLLLGAVLFPLIMASYFLDAMSMAEVSCRSISAAACDRVAIADSVVRWVPWLIFGASVIVSIVFIARRWFAFVVPLFGGIAVIACISVWDSLIGSALG